MASELKNLPPFILSKVKSRGILSKFVHVHREEGFIFRNQSTSQNVMKSNGSMLYNNIILSFSWLPHVSYGTVADNTQADDSLSAAEAI